MTVVNPKSISGINSITTGSGSDNLLTIHTSDANNTERLRIDSTGATKIVTGIVTTLTATTGIVTTLTANTVTSLGAISGTTGTFSSHVSLGDSDELRLGDSDDLKLYHDGSNSRIHEGGTGVLAISGSEVHIQNAAQSENCAKFIEDGAVELYHNNVKIIETHAQGAAIASGSMVMPAMNSFSSQILVGASGFIGNYHDGTTNQQLIIGTNQYFDSAYKSRTNTTAAHIQFFDRSFRFNTAAAPGSAGGTLTQVQALRIDTDGVKFGTDTATANALDDYEEGTWTPLIRNSSGTGTAGVSNYGYYTKVGNVVHAHATVHWTALNSGATSSMVMIVGLPHPSKNASNYRSTTLIGGQVVGVHNGNDDGMNIAIGCDANMSAVYVTAVNGSATGGYNYTHYPTVLTSGTIYGFSFTYLTN